MLEKIVGVCEMAAFAVIYLVACVAVQYDPWDYSPPRNVAKLAELVRTNCREPRSADYYPCLAVYPDGSEIGLIFSDSPLLRGVIYLDKTDKKGRREWRGFGAFLREVVTVKELQRR
ncbi:MAG: hypothetical protein UY81_C0043G0007 [Candidatus Giovannonibacteria bacterium GW2011_GWA2_53_7]|uniref:Uncharacterized protein n=1 Tax=Candidatus Giovannonibacteria bacterium GW2011_GWA2_53_7 TaxID=1618650 RepID=A0A0G1XWR1_9BACT|nr:MAG: hypothetical protein UY81_C0043G0007 [Candidatus Giovannonibacteria bacterium GW2011_GWA2_53_7]